MSRFTRAGFATVSTAAAIALLAGCAGPSASNGAADGEPVEGGTLTYLEPQTWTSLYPGTAGFYPNGGIVNNITDRLLYQDPETLELEPWIATALPEVNEDATEYTFTLRDDVTYSDGTPLDAENVAKNFDLLGLGDADRTFAVSEQVTNYERSEVVDEHTVRFHFTAPAPGFAQATSAINAGLVSTATLDLSLEDFGPGNAENIIGSGPFVVSGEEIGTETNLEVREDYDWAPASVEHQGRAYLDGIDYIVAGEDSVRVGTVTSRQAHIARQIEAPDEAQFAGDGLGLLAAPTNGVNNGLSFRFRDPAVSELEVRQAIIAGIDREAIIETLFSDNYKLATGALASAALGYTDTSEFYAYDQDRAVELLDNAGWAPGSDGVREKDGVRLSLAFNEALPQPRSREVVTLIQDQLAEIGVEVELEPGDMAAQTAATNEIGKLQVYHSMVGRADFDVIKSQYYSKNRNTLHNGHPADGSVGDQELDDLLLAVASSPTTEGREQASAAAQQRLAEQAYILPIFEEPQVFGYTDAVQGFHTESIGRPSFYSTWLAQ